MSKNKKSTSIESAKVENVAPETIVENVAPETIEVLTPEQELEQRLEQFKAAMLKKQELELAKMLELQKATMLKNIEKEKAAKLDAEKEKEVIAQINTITEKFLADQITSFGAIAGRAIKAFINGKVLTVSINTKKSNGTTRKSTKDPLFMEFTNYQAIANYCLQNNINEVERLEIFKQAFAKGKGAEQDEAWVKVRIGTLMSRATLEISEPAAKVESSINTLPEPAAN